MKRILMILAALTLLISAAALAEEPSSAADPQFKTFVDAIVSMDEGDAYTVTDGYAIAVIHKNGLFFRVVASYDEHAAELYAAYREDGEMSFEEYQSLCSYVQTLPVQYTEELNVVPFTQEELDSLAGKTIGEVMSEPWEIKMRNYPDDAEPGKEIVFPMVKGFCEYELVINEPYEVYQERRAADRYEPVTVMSLKNYLDLTVKYVRYTGIHAFNALLLEYRADGTLKQGTDYYSQDYDYDLAEEIADYLTAQWKDTEPDQEAKEAMIAELTAKYPEAENMIRQIVEGFH